MLDTNTVSHLVKGHPGVGQRVAMLPLDALCISAITEGELLFGLAKRPTATRLHVVVGEFLRRVDVLPWGRETAQRYGIVRADMARQGKVLAPLDLLIAAHALEARIALVTNDRAFSQVTGLVLEDWTKT